MTQDQIQNVAPRLRRAYEAIIRHIISRGVRNCEFTAIGVEISGKDLEPLMPAIIVKVGKNPQHRNIYRLVDDISKETVEYYNRY